MGDVPDEIEPYHASVLQSFQYCLNQEEDFVSQVDNTTLDDGSIVDGIIDSKNLPHGVDVVKMSSYINLEEDVVHEGFDHSLQNFHLNPFPLMDEDVINDTSSQEIIFETLHCGTIVMSRSQPMTLVLCQVVPYPLLEENDEHT
jgi:hypothetical protein